MADPLTTRTDKLSDDDIAEQSSYEGKWARPFRGHLRESGFRFHGNESRACWDCEHFRVSAFPNRKCNAVSGQFIWAMSPEGERRENGFVVAEECASFTVAAEITDPSMCDRQQSHYVIQLLQGFLAKGEFQTLNSLLDSKPKPGWITWAPYMLATVAHVRDKLPAYAGLYQRLYDALPVETRDGELFGLEP